MKLRRLAVVAFTMMMVILTSGIAVAASLVLPSDIYAAAYTCRVLQPRVSTIGSSPFDTLRVSMKIPVCYNGKQIWIEPGKKIRCRAILVSKGSTRGTPKFGRCEPNGQGYYARTNEIDVVSDTFEKTPLSTITYQYWVTLNASGKIINSNADLYT